MAVSIACLHCGHFVSISDEKYASFKGKTAKCNKRGEAKCIGIEAEGCETC